MRCWWMEGGGGSILSPITSDKQRKSFPLLLSLIFRHYNNELYEDLEGRGQATLLGNAAMNYKTERESQF